MTIQDALNHIQNDPSLSFSMNYLQRYVGDYNVMIRFAMNSYQDDFLINCRKCYYKHDVEVSTVLLLSDLMSHEWEIITNPR